MEKAPGVDGLFQRRDPLIGFLSCDHTPALRFAHAFDEARHWPHRFIIRSNARERLNMDVNQASRFEQPIHPMRDTWLTHAIVAKPKEAPRHFGVRAVEDLRFMISIDDNQQSAWAQNPQQFRERAGRVGQMLKRLISIAAIKGLIGKLEALNVPLKEANG